MLKEHELSLTYNKRNKTISMKNILLPLIATVLMTITVKAQLVIDNATFFIGENAVVTVQGNLTTNVDIQAGGAAATQGKIQMKGSSLQSIAAGGRVIPRLEIDNASHVQLTEDLRVENRIDLLSGRLRTFNNNLILPATVTVVGMNASRFIETNGTGAVRQLVPANVASLKMVPIGNGANYTPIEFTSTGATYAAGAYISFRATGMAVPTPARHPRTESYLTNSWEVTKSGITGGAQNVEGTYTNGQITGTEADIRGFFWNGSSWSLAGGGQNATNNMVGTSVAGNTGTLYGMNRFLLASPKVFLEGAYNSGTGLMNDNLRAGTNLIPTSDPYRSAPYNTSFSHVNNSVAETVAASLFNDNGNPNDNIVDWVYVELRNVTSPTQAAVVQTRSVLVQRDGDLVDVDGVSPVYFKNVDAGATYAVAIRHRNHIGLSTSPAVPLSLGLANTNINVTSLPTASLFGTANTNYVRTGGNINLLYSGNANSNTNVRFSGIANDRDFMLGSILSGNRALLINNVYSQGDVNMNRNVRFAGIANDRDFMLATPLSGNQAALKTQSLPAN